MTDAKDAEVHAEPVDIGTGEFIRVTVSFPLGVPGEDGRMGSVLVFPAQLVHTVVAAVLGAVKR